jgi:predicted nucleotidyltransferase
MTLDELTTRLGTVLQSRNDLRFAALFGSVATRGIDQARDIDVAISFIRPLGLMDLARLADELESAVGREVDVIDVDDATTLLRWEVVKIAKPILVRDRNAWLELLARVPIEYADLRPYLERESRGLHRALQEKRWSGSTSSATKSGG